MDEALSSPSSPRKDRKEKKKKKHHRHEAENEEDAAARKERRRVKKQKKKNKRGSPSPNVSGGNNATEKVSGVSEGDKSPSWTADAFIPSQAEQIVSDLNFLQSEAHVKEESRSKRQNGGKFEVIWFPKTFFSSRDSAFTQCWKDEFYGSDLLYNV